MELLNFDQMKNQPDNQQRQKLFQLYQLLKIFKIINYRGKENQQKKSPSKRRLEKLFDEIFIV
ncbi:MAG: hypothetical protein IJT73_01125 [Selenomonadaceae bacterium]|nr:hypothetical protein [Selenomonadaceae bacterium]